MENYQMFFPCSSSSSPDMAAAPQLATSMQAAYNNFHGHMMSSSSAASNIGSGGRGFFLGLESSTTTADSSSNLVNNNHGGVNVVVPINRAEVKEVCQMGSDEKQLDQMKYNNKGEKKIRKPKFAFQTRSQVDILDDGYRWRKYGQKAVKNNKFPRSYYRCTQQGCNVKKQVQRLTKDEAIVVTTYEGMHTHPIDKPTDNFEHILSQMQVYTPF